MGRVENDEPQVQETIDDSFPENELLTKPRSVVPSNNKPQSQSSHPHREEDLYYVPPHQEQRPESFPPQRNDEYEPPHQQVPSAFPPINMQFAQQTMPPAPQVVVQTGHPVMASPIQPPFNVHGMAPAQVQDKAWSSDLFDCMKDPQNALITAFVPCITFGQIAEIMDYGKTPCTTSGMMYGVIAFCIAAPCIMSCTYRTKMRAKFGLIESPAQDWMVHCFCEWCALCQEYRQLKDMGYDPAIGWLGNQARMGLNVNQQFGMTPPSGQRMMM